MSLYSDDLFCQFAEQSKHSCILFDIGKGVFTYHNLATEKLLAAANSISLAQPAELLRLVHPDDVRLVKQRYQYLLKSQKNVHLVFRLIYDETEKHLHANCALVKKQNDFYVCAIIEDITEAEHNRIHIEQINARKNITLEVLSHDLREPMAMIEMTTSHIANHLPSAEEEFKDSLKFIRDMCARNQELIRSMVNHEFLKSSVIELKRDRADIVWELREVIRFYRRSRLSEIRNFSFVTDHEKVYVHIDSMKLMQVINNLISNAIKFTAEGGEIKLTLQDLGESIKISVSDDGIGIPIKLRDKIFSPDRKALRKGLSGEDSGGLGLGIAQKIVNLHKGKIYFLSEEGTGTTFYIEIPKHTTS